MTTAVSPYKKHFIRLAKYNKWAYTRLFQTMDTVISDNFTESSTKEELYEKFFKSDQQLFFGSAHGTLVHLYASESLWFMRFTNQETLRGLVYGETGKLWATEDPSEWEKLIPDYETLKTVIFAQCDDWIQLVQGIEEEQLVEKFKYKTTNGEETQRVRGDVLDHVFNHSTHHRGQITAVLTRISGRKYSPVIDLNYFVE